MCPRKYNIPCRLSNPITWKKAKIFKRFLNLIMVAFEVLSRCYGKRCNAYNSSDDSNFNEVIGGLQQITNPSEESSNLNGDCGKVDETKSNEVIGGSQQTGKPLEESSNLNGG